MGLVDEGQADTTARSAKPALVGRPWRPGQSGNPSGANRRQKGLATLIRRSTKQGKELVDFVLDVARGKPIKTSVLTLAGIVVDVERRSTIRDRLEAVAWLADRGWGRAKEVIQLEGEGLRAPVQIVILGEGGDPLARPEQPQARRVIEARALSASPDPDRPETPPKRSAGEPPDGEIGFTMEGG